MGSIRPWILAAVLVSVASVSRAADGVTKLSAPDGSTVVIYRDNYGVPHIRAGSEAGVFFGQGYAAAEDRLFQMETFRRAALGRLSEVGLAAPATDRQVRAVFYTDDERREQLERLPAHVRVMIEAYTAGINGYLADVLANPSALLPVQFHVLGFAPEPWLPTQVVAVVQFFMRRFGQYGGQELQRLVELQTFGPAWFEENRPINDPDAPVTVTDAMTTTSKHAASRSTARSDAGAIAETLPRISSTLVRELDQQRAAAEADLARLRIPGLGSFAVVVGRSHSASGNVMLLGAPQADEFRPSPSEVNVSHEVELDAPTLKVSGMSIGGMPGVIIGRTPRVAWSLTSGNSDNTDTFIEVLDPTGTRYLHNGTFRDFEVLEEADLGFARLRTVHGPVIGLDSGAGIAYSWQMTFWNHEVDMISAFYDVWKARSLQEFETALTGIPMNFNVLYAGRDQEIGYWHVGWLLRSNQTLSGPDPRLPRLGGGIHDWDTQPFLTFSELPSASGEAQGYLSNWNNKPSTHWNNGDNIPWSVVFRPERTLRVSQINDHVESALPLSFGQLKGVPEAIGDRGFYQQVVEFAAVPLKDRTLNLVAPGQSGFIGALTGPDAHFADQWALHQTWEFKDMVYNTPLSIWPPDHQFRPIDVQPFLDAAEPASARIASIWSDEPVIARGTGRTEPDIVLVDATTVNLRAERDPHDNGRVYTVHVSAPDPSGHIGTAALFQVVVPANQGQRPVAIDDGPVYQVTPDGLVVFDEYEGASRAPDRSEAVRLANHPNPFNPRTVITYELPVATEVRLEVFDVLGRRLAVLADGVREAGRYEVPFDASLLSTGLYLYRLTTESETVTASMLLAR